MDVGIRELKARLSEYLDRAERGEVVTITQRGQPKAILAPLPGRLRVLQGIEEGWVTPATARGLGPARRHRSLERVLDVLGDDRAE
jgi:prevent-host-death family protein